MELKIEQLQLPEEIKFNYDELKTAVATRLQDYKSLVYTEDTLKDAKADRAGLNRLSKSLNDERIRIEKEYMQPFSTFKEQIKELVTMVNEASDSIGVQIKDFEEQKKVQKRADIEKLFAEVFSADMPWLNINLLFDDKWLNASVSMKLIQKSLEDEKQAITEELKILSRMKDYSLEATEVYKKTLSLQQAQNEADHLLEVDRIRQAAEESRKQADALREAQQTSEIASQNDENQAFINEVNNSSIEAEKAEIEPETIATNDTSEEIRQWIAFKAYLTVDQAKELANWFKSNGIQFGRA